MKQHTSRFLNLVNETKTRIKEITPEELKQKLDKNKSLMLIDVREDQEWDSGHIPGAIHLSKGLIERDIEKLITDPEAEIVVYCSGGYRCALVADSLQKMGYQSVYSLKYGSQGWIDSGFPIE